MFIDYAYIDICTQYALYYGCKKLCRKHGVFLLVHMASHNRGQLYLFLACIKREIF